MHISPFSGSNEEAVNIKKLVWLELEWIMGFFLMFLEF